MRLFSPQRRGEPSAGAILDPSMRSLYTLLIYLATPVVLLYLFLRGLRSPDYLRRWPERFGRFDPPQKTGAQLLAPEILQVPVP